uniref:Uncharacterized protein n=1 Tax=Hemiselmis andersenii TaxID=464988 RepID=A0A6U2AID4_HEMAN
MSSSHNRHSTPSGHRSDPVGESDAPPDMRRTSSMPEAGKDSEVKALDRARVTIKSFDDFFDKMRHSSPHKREYYESFFLTGLPYASLRPDDEPEDWGKHDMNVSTDFSHASSSESSVATEEVEPGLLDAPRESGACTLVQEGGGACMEDGKGGGPRPSGCPL